MWYESPGLGESWLGFGWGLLFVGLIVLSGLIVVAALLSLKDWLVKRHTAKKEEGQ